MARVRSRRVLLIITILIAVTFLTLPWLTTSEDKVEDKNDTTNDTDEPYPHPKNILKVPKDAGRAENTTTQEETDHEEKATDEPEEMCPPNVGDTYITLQGDAIKVDMARLQADGWEKLDCRYQPFLRKMDHDVA
ncbi:uncharacterized protein LOC144919472 [Branchiostoma floridae x Branchiostoma belcheri]